MKTRMLYFTLVLALFVVPHALTQQVFPRAVYIDPYWAGLGWTCDQNIQWNYSSWNDSGYYYPQMDRMGVTHVMTNGDNVSMNANTTRIKFINENTGDIRLYARSVDPTYEVGGTGDPSRYIFRQPPAPAVGEDIQDPPFTGPRVYHAHVGTHSPGLLLEDQNRISPIDQPYGDNYYFILRAKIVGTGLASDVVARLHITETYPSQQPQGYPTPHQAINQLRDGPQPSHSPANDVIDILASDFSATGTYVPVTKYTFLAGRDANYNFYQTHINLEWLATRDLYVDYIDVRNSDNYRIFASPDSTYWLQQAAAYVQSVNNINPTMTQWWYRDEPWPASFRLLPE